MIKIIKTSREWQQTCKTEKAAGKSIGFVPTMGALHEGHTSLMKRARDENDISAVSIFVNPTQFNNPKDLKNYPITQTEDLEILEEARVDYLFFPNFQELYPDNFLYKVIETELSGLLCGATRQGHFDGVLTVVMKLLNLTFADRAYLGEKDWQQYRLIKGMAAAFFIETEIIPCPLIREATGLALSSRNKLLTNEEKKIAPLFFKNLSSGKPLKEIKKELEKVGFKVDYLKKLEGRLLGAVFLGEVRLIDNVKI